MCASQFWSYSAEELRCLNKRTLHGLLSSPSLALKSEDALLDLLIDIDSETFEFWSYIEISLLSSDALARYAQLLPFDRLTSDIWSKLVSHLRCVSVDDLRLRRFGGNDTFAGQSIILSTIPSPLKQFEGKKWHLLYRGSRDGFRSSDFHRQCDGCPNTVTLILTITGSIFGGFTSVPWDSRTGSRSDGSPASFLFTVKDPRGGSPSTFPIAIPNQAKRIPIRWDPSYGPAFGGGQDLWVSDNCQVNASTCSGSGTYRNAQGAFIGEPAFRVKEIEVLSVIL
jgi:hypothetical protein